MKMKIKSLLISVIIFMSITCVFSQDTLNRTDAQGRKIGYWKKYENNKLVYEGQFNKDVPVGEFRYYYEDGSLKSISNFLNGTHKVQSTLFHKNGKKSGEGLFIDQRRHGEWKYYSAAGKLIKLESYKNGEKHGEWKTYSAQTEILLVDETFDNGLLHGVQKEYYITGDIKSITPYISGKRNGVGEYYSTENILSSRGMFHNDALIGTWDYFDAAGKVRKSIEYEKSINKKCYLFFYQGNKTLKLNIDSVLFIQKVENGIELTVRNGEKFQFADDFTTLHYWIDPLIVTQISPSLMVAFDAIRGYKPVDEDENEEGDEEAVIVILRPAFDYEVIVRGDYALIIKSYFNTEIPTLEEE